ncbi:hypothetical protein GXW83_05035 [Streptacidiphilus sp. PB12-B1b]|uniref:hypothetical protein n=1 Tax=Streptacidiphilus sp. PB12-B1b TaxID=2705012 RepID=UPI0015FB7907|nr:hypothetical protein [Streptacidiphilus sp. PB12-B1b]QMU75217.1 hypothetical protein GXW83_05035 [Streptacidiphilus sp. PB12-B1b]
MTADPVHALRERHLVCCEAAVHPLEIAAELEAAGIGPGTAGRYRHADVFSLAEELYARVPRRPAALRPPLPADPWRRRALPSALTAVLHLLPGLALWAAGRTLWPGAGPGPAAALGLAAGLFAVAVAVTAGRGCSLPARLGYALGLAVLLASATAAPGADPVMAAALACGTGAAEWCARWFRHIGWGHLDTARSRAEFGERMRPVLPVAVGLYLSALSATTFAALALARRRAAGGGVAEAVAGAGGTAWAAQGCTGLLLLLVLLLWRCGRHRDALAALLCCLSAVGVAAALTDRPGAAGIPGPAPALLWGCGATAALLLPYAWAVLLRPESHRPESHRSESHRPESHRSEDRGVSEFPLVSGTSRTRPGSAQGRTTS